MKITINGILSRILMSISIYLAAWIVGCYIGRSILIPIFNKIWLPLAAGWLLSLCVGIFIKFKKLELISIIFASICFDFAMFLLDNHILYHDPPDLITLPFIFIIIFRSIFVASPILICFILRIIANKIKSLL